MLLLREHPRRSLPEYLPQAAGRLGAMLLLREFARRSLRENLAGTAFGLFVAGLVVWLVVLYWSAPFDL
jgi:hypothetical protein